MAAITNLSIFVKRVEFYQTEDYVRQAFTRMGFGEVSTINFIQRIDDAGVHKYNAAIIDFKQWYKSDATAALFADIRNASNGTKQVFHSPTKYWFVTEYHLSEEDSSLQRDNVARNTITGQCSDQDRIQQLEVMVESMAAQLIHVAADRELQAVKITELNDVILKQQNTEASLSKQLEDHISQQAVAMEAESAQALSIANSNCTNLNATVLNLHQVIADCMSRIQSFHGIEKEYWTDAAEMSNQIHSLTSTNKDLMYRMQILINGDINDDIDSSGCVRMGNDDDYEGLDDEAYVHLHFASERAAREREQAPRRDHADEPYFESHFAAEVAARELQVQRNGYDELASSRAFGNTTGILTVDDLTPVTNPNTSALYQQVVEGAYGNSTERLTVEDLTSVDDLTSVEDLTSVPNPNTSALYRECTDYSCGV